MTAQGDDAAARPSDVPEELLDDRGGADVLDADRVLRPADGVAEGARPIASRVVADRLAVVEELLDRATARLRDELRCVARVVLLQELEDASRVLERLVLGRRLAVLQAAAVAAVARLLTAGRLE